jgi:hypothetical protein
VHTELNSQQGHLELLLYRHVQFTEETRQLFCAQQDENSVSEGLRLKLWCRCYEWGVTCTHHRGSVRGRYVHSFLTPEAGYQCTAGLCRTAKLRSKLLSLMTAGPIGGKGPRTESSSTLGHGSMKQAWNFDIDCSTWTLKTQKLLYVPPALTHCGR